MSKIRRNYVLNLLNKWLKGKLRNFLKFWNKVVTKFTRTKAQKQLTELRFLPNNKYSQNVHVSYPASY